MILRSISGKRTLARQIRLVLGRSFNVGQQYEMVSLVCSSSISHSCVVCGIHFWFVPSICTWHYLPSRRYHLRSPLRSMVVFLCGTDCHHFLCGSLGVSCRCMRNLRVSIPPYSSCMGFIFFRAPRGNIFCVADVSDRRVLCGHSRWTTRHL